VRGAYLDGGWHCLPHENDNENYCWHNTPEPIRKVVAVRDKNLEEADGGLDARGGHVEGDGQDSGDLLAEGVEAEVGGGDSAAHSQAIVPVLDKTRTLNYRESFDILDIEKHHHYEKLKN
jgi:hypothetical protein